MKTITNIRSSSLNGTFGLFILALFVFNISVVSGQETKEVIQFSGLVVAGDSLFGMSGVHVINKNSRQGGTTDISGYFSLAALEHDTILFSFIGFKPKHIIIPKNLKDNELTLMVPLELDTTQIDAVEILPYPSEQLFKHAFVHTELPEDKLMANMNYNLDPRRLRKMMNEMDMTASMNYKHYTLQQIKQYEQPNFLPSSQIFNPFAWVKLIKAIKNGDFKREE